MATQSEILQAGVDADEFYVGPAVLLLQAVSNYNTSGESASAFPEGLEDIINITSGVAMTANGWEYQGYTENLALARTRTTVQLDADQEARVKTVHDSWENSITVTALQTSLARYQEWMRGHASDPSVAAGAIPAQHKVRVGNPSDIQYRRAAVLFVDDRGYLVGWVYRKANVRSTGGPTFTRTGRVEWPLELNCFSDTRVVEVNDRVLRVYMTDASIE